MNMAAAAAMSPNPHWGESPWTPPWQQCQPTHGEHCCPPWQQQDSLSRQDMQPWQNYAHPQQQPIMHRQSYARSSIASQQPGGHQSFRSQHDKATPWQPVQHQKGSWQQQEALCQPQQQVYASKNGGPESPSVRGGGGLAFGANADDAKVQKRRQQQEMQRELAAQIEERKVRKRDEDRRIREDDERHEQRSRDDFVSAGLNNAAACKEPPTGVHGYGGLSAGGGGPSGGFGGASGGGGTPMSNGTPALGQNSVMPSPGSRAASAAERAVGSRGGCNDQQEERRRKQEEWQNQLAAQVEEARQRKREEERRRVEEEARQDERMRLEIELENQRVADEKRRQNAREETEAAPEPERKATREGRQTRDRLRDADGAEMGRTREEPMRETRSELRKTRDRVREPRSPNREHGCEMRKTRDRVRESRHGRRRPRTTGHDGEQSPHRQRRPKAESPLLGANVSEAGVPKSQCFGGGGMLPQDMSSWRQATVHAATPWMQAAGAGAGRSDRSLGLHGFVEQQMQMASDMQRQVDELRRQRDEAREQAMRVREEAINDRAQALKDMQQSLLDQLHPRAARKVSPPNVMDIAMVSAYGGSTAATLGFDGARGAASFSQPNHSSAKGRSTAVSFHEPLAMVRESDPCFAPSFDSDVARLDAAAALPFIDSKNALDFERSIVSESRFVELGATSQLLGFELLQLPTSDVPAPAVAPTSPEVAVVIPEATVGADDAGDARASAAATGTTGRACASASRPLAAISQFVAEDVENISPSTVESARPNAALAAPIPTAGASLVAVSQLFVGVSGHVDASQTALQQRSAEVEPPIADPEAGKVDAASFPTVLAKSEHAAASGAVDPINGVTVSAGVGGVSTPATATTSQGGQFGGATLAGSSHFVSEGVGHPCGVAPPLLAHQDLPEPSRAGWSDSAEWSESVVSFAAPALSTHESVALPLSSPISGEVVQAEPVTAEARQEQSTVPLSSAAPSESLRKAAIGGTSPSTLAVASVSRTSGDGAAADFVKGHLPEERAEEFRRALSRADGLDPNLREGLFELLGGASGPFSPSPVAPASKTTRATAAATVPAAAPHATKLASATDVVAKAPLSLPQIVAGKIASKPSRSAEPASGQPQSSTSAISEEASRNANSPTEAVAPTVYSAASCSAHTDEHAPRQPKSSVDSRLERQPRSAEGAFGQAPRSAASRSGLFSRGEKSSSSVRPPRSADALSGRPPCSPEWASDFLPRNAQIALDRPRSSAESAHEIPPRSAESGSGRPPRLVEASNGRSSFSALAGAGAAVLEPFGANSACVDTATTGERGSSATPSRRISEERRARNAALSAAAATPEVSQLPLVKRRISEERRAHSAAVAERTAPEAPVIGILPAGQRRPLGAAAADRDDSLSKLLESAASPMRPSPCGGSGYGSGSTPARSSQSRQGSRALPWLRSSSVPQGVY
eukprot:TRINITY_DN74289_c0_g1_i1.p1 TRINITY_DN74289_c0_g1~~TRINITY_DN74289_c0_g1_i1.p1  ORF type:complete len:1444 (-),score=276.72 TRINITY_DN74289_c0_g1_i1:175-4506(-)